VILRAPAGRAAAMVASYIGAAYWFTASTSFANPAAVFGRMFSDTFAGIAPSSAPGFVLAEFVGAAVGLAIHNVLEPRLHPSGHPNVIEASGAATDDAGTASTSRN
jgi:glycerol uptake facilitator-like aquaporin